MRLVRIGTAAVSLKVGDFPGNQARILEAAMAARDVGVHILSLPELCISGYSLEDRVFWPDIAERSRQTLHEIASACPDVALVLGLPVRMRSHVYNGAALAFGGRVHGVVLKRHLPTYSIFYEGRNWTAWPGGVDIWDGVPAGDLVFRLPFGMVSIKICEDLWSANAPARERVALGAEVICNPSASPFVPGKNDQRERMVRTTAANLKCVYAYANVLGCDSSRLVFDGGGFVATPDAVVAKGPIVSFEPWTLSHGVVDLDDLARMRGENTTWRQDFDDAAPGRVQVVDATADATFEPAPIETYAAQLPPSFYTPPPAHPAGTSRNPAMDDLFDALTLGLRDYFEKVGVFDRFLIALSGGRDSALCLLLAVAAAKQMQGGTGAAHFADRVSTVYLPHKANSTGATQSAAHALADELGVPFQVSSIHEEAEQALAKTAALSGGIEHVTDLAKQNLQARIRGAMMLNWANCARGLVLVTSNLSEAAVGYSTTGGDNEGGYSPIANVPKSLVTELLAYIAKRDGIPALDAVLAIPPSAELAPGQEDEVDLMPYAVLDDLIYLYARLRKPLAACWRILCARHTEHDREQLRSWTARFAVSFAASQWKRDQHPVSMKVLDLDLDPKTGFRFPVTQSIEHELQALSEAE